MTPTDRLKAREEAILKLCDLTGQRTHADLLNWLDNEGLVSGLCTSMDPDNGGPADCDLFRAVEKLKAEELTRQGQGSFDL